MSYLLKVIRKLFDGRNCNCSSFIKRVSETKQCYTIVMKVLCLKKKSKGALDLRANRFKLLGFGTNYISHHNK